jgi:Uma2 family endonuclease
MNIEISRKRRGEPFYIESDGKPMGESEQHILNIRYLLEPLDAWFAADTMVYVAGNMFVHYERGNRNRHVSPDVFIVRGVPKAARPGRRRNYLVWEEGRAPDVVFEITSKTTKAEDLVKKRAIYQDVLKVSEYFLFDPFEEYLRPPFQGFRLTRGKYRPIRPVAGRLPSKALGLHVEAHGELLRLYDPAARHLLPIPPETRAALREAEAEAERLRREVEELRRRLANGP